MTFDKAYDALKFVLPYQVIVVTQAEQTVRNPLCKVFRLKLTAEEDFFCDICTRKSLFPLDQQDGSQYEGRWQQLNIERVQIMDMSMSTSIQARSFTRRVS